MWTPCKNKNSTLGVDMSVIILLTRKQNKLQKKILKPQPTKNNETSPELYKKSMKLVKRRRHTIRNLAPFFPTNEQSIDLLREFSVNFLKNDFSILVEQLRIFLYSNQSLTFDTSHFLWLITYFLRHASLAQMEFKGLNKVLSVETACFLTFEGN